MNNFDEAAHPRATTGQFTDKPQSAPEVQLERVPPHFTADLARFDNALAPFIFEVDGAKFISPDAPPDLVRGYSALVQQGYANGWIA